jgi:hypothetical protein
LTAGGEGPLGLRPLPLGFEEKEKIMASQKKIDEERQTKIKKFLGNFNQIVTELEAPPISITGRQAIQNCKGEINFDKSFLDGLLPQQDIDDIASVLSYGYSWDSSKPIDPKMVQTASRLKTTVQELFELP